MNSLFHVFEQQHSEHSIWALTTSAAVHYDCNKFAIISVAASCTLLTSLFWTAILGRESCPLGMHAWRIWRGEGVGGGKWGRRGRVEVGGKKGDGRAPSIPS